jgi:hypothetical protein
VPRLFRSPATPTKAIGPRPKAKRKAAKKSPLVGKAPLGSRLARKPRARNSSAFPDFIPFATCLLVERPPNGPDWVHEISWTAGASRSA